ncbi:MAG: 2OG-Fe(II) oxygenase [Magnetovibrio sp.]|nr:2OG-Fe(II) oxygenase [Magnetovibrio sp.]
MLKEPARSGTENSLQFCSVVADAFSPAQCAQLTEFFTQFDAADGGLVAGQFEQKIRQSSLVWLPESDEHAWVETRIAKLIADANRQLFGFALDGFDEQLQLAAYGPGHYYDWHIDRGRGKLAARRKLTIAVQLSDPACYGGGELEINADGRPFAAPRDQGTAVVFAATTLHRVTPVTSGLRHSLVAWTHGPAFV